MLQDGVGAEIEEMRFRLQDSDAIAVGEVQRRRVLPEPFLVLHGQEPVQGTQQAKVEFQADRMVGAVLEEVVMLEAVAAIEKLGAVQGKAGRLGELQRLPAACVGDKHVDVDHWPQFR